MRTFIELWQEGLVDPWRAQEHIAEQLPQVCAEHGFGYWRSVDAVSPRGEAKVAYLGIGSYSRYDLELLDEISPFHAEKRLPVDRIIVLDVMGTEGWSWESITLVMPERYVATPMLAVWQSGACLYSTVHVQPVRALLLAAPGAAPAAEVNDHRNEKP